MLNGQNLPDTSQNKKQLNEDSGETKCPMELLPLEQLAEVARVFEHGSKQYGAWNWKKSKPYEIDLYMGAILRHLTEYQKGQIHDRKSGLPHMAHVVANALIMMWIDSEND